MSPHPHTPCVAVRALDATLERGPADRWRLGFRFTGHIDALRVPQTLPPSRADGLWRHLCCELFVMSGQGGAYREFNFSPSGCWAAYEFDSWRSGMRPAALAVEPVIACRQAAGTLELTAELALPGASPAWLALCAVVEDKAGALSYWALHHAPGKPDFHHLAGFVPWAD